MSFINNNNRIGCLYLNDDDEYDEEVKQKSLGLSVVLYPTFVCFLYKEYFFYNNKKKSVYYQFVVNEIYVCVFLPCMCDIIKH